MYFSAVLACVCICECVCVFMWIRVHLYVHALYAVQGVCVCTYEGVFIPPTPPRERLVCVCVCVGGGAIHLWKGFQSRFCDVCWKLCVFNSKNWLGMLQAIALFTIYLKRYIYAKKNNNSKKDNSWWDLKTSLFLYVADVFQNKLQTNLKQSCTAASSISLTVALLR